MSLSPVHIVLRWSTTLGHGAILQTYRSAGAKDIRCSDPIRLGFEIGAMGRASPRGSIRAPDESSDKSGQAKLGATGDAQPTGIMLGFIPSIYKLILLKSVAAIIVGGDFLDRSTQPTRCQMSIHHSNFHYYALRGEEKR